MDFNTECCKGKEGYSYSELAIELYKYIVGVCWYYNTVLFTSLFVMLLMLNIEFCTVYTRHIHTYICYVYIQCNLQALNLCVNFWNCIHEEILK